MKQVDTFIYLQCLSPGKFTDTHDPPSRLLIDSIRLAADAVHAQDIEAAYAEGFGNVFGIAGNKPEVTDRIFTQFFSVRADSQNHAAFAGDNPRGLGQSMFFSLENEVDSCTAAPRCAHDGEESFEHVAGRNDAHQPSFVDHRQAADLLFQHDLRRFLQRCSRGDGQRVFGHHAVDLRVLQVAAMLAQVTVGNNADELAVGDDWKPAETARLHFVRRKDEQINRLRGHRFLGHAVCHQHIYLLGSNMSRHLADSSLCQFPQQVRATDETHEFFSIYDAQAFVFVLHHGPGSLVN